MEPTRQPILNVPPVIIAILAALCIVHAVRVLVLSNAADIEFLLRFSFIPARYFPTDSRRARISLRTPVRRILSCVTRKSYSMRYQVTWCSSSTA